eukprot:TRINITY_DN1356_c0_g1_i2.p1 TRINITY_DN1356_c0_g1~~TRINITY_DN1356_c0_g1_i2.p1  ORF type:complete len:325 (+),score=64.40 TRINITY_DN1356_c0_g1_i2:91-975(+)
MLILSGDDVKASISIVQAVAAQKEAFEALFEKRCDAPLRPVIQTEFGPSLFMPAYAKSASNSLVIKIASVRPENAAKGLPTIPAKIALLDDVTGHFLALIDATYLTALRTAAGSGYATSVLAREDSRFLLVFGAGMQAKAHLLTMLTVRPSLEKVTVVNRTLSKAQTLIEEIKDDFPTVSFYAVSSGPPSEGTDAVGDCVKEADIVCTTTNSSTPLFDGKLLKEGAHINSVGAYTPKMQEVDSETVSRSVVVLDDIESCMEEAGDLLQPLSEGIIDSAHIYCAVGDTKKLKTGY